MQPKTSLNKTRLTLIIVLLVVVGFGVRQTAVAQAANLVGVCPSSCGVKIQITRATVTEALDGVQVQIDWTMNPPDPALKLTILGVFAKADLGLDNVKKSVNVDVSARTATLKLTRGREFDVKDIKTLQVEISAFADPLAPASADSITDRKIVGQGNDAAVEVTWNAPGPLRCTAARILVEVSARNEKNDKLTGQKIVTLSERKARVELKGSLNKKGLNTPEATVKVIHDSLGCTTSNSFAAGQFLVQGTTGAGSFGVNTAKVTITKLALRDDTSGRVDADINWDAFVPTNFKTTRFDLKFDIEDTSGKVTTQTRSALGTQRSTVAGSLAVASNFRRLTLTLIATFANDAGTQVTTREDQKTESLTRKQLPPTPPPAPPAPKLEITRVFSAPLSGTHNVEVNWRADLPAGITAQSFIVDVTVKDVRTRENVTKSVAFGGNARQGVVTFSAAEVGKTIQIVQTKLLANLQRADGSRFELGIKQSGGGGSTSDVVR